MKQKNNSLKEIADVLLGKDHFTIIGHSVPDGDCIGSLLAMHQTLKNAGKESNILLKDSVPANYLFLSLCHEIHNEKTIDRIHENIIFLDCGEKSRCGIHLDACTPGTEKTRWILNIDHHETNDYFGDLNYVDASAAATGEILAELIPLFREGITSDIAEALYTALVMDTGNFQYSNTTSRTLKTAARLLDYGADLNRIRIALYESKDRRELQMLALALQHMQFSSDGKIAWMYLTLEEIRSIHAEDFHPEGIVSYLRSIQGVEIAVHFREMRPGYFKISLRSKNNVDVSKIAEHFGGGGHIQASGARFTGSIDQAVQTIIPYIGDVLKTTC